MFLFRLDWKVLGLPLPCPGYLLHLWCLFTSSKSGGSVCLRFEFSCLSLVLGSVNVSGDSVS